MSAVEWMDPPPSRRSSDHDRGLNTFTDAVVDALRERPGRWARVDSQVSNTRGNGWQQAAGRKRCQAVVRTTDSGLVDVYARWRG